MMFTILNRLRGTWSIMAKVNAIVLAVLIYLVAGDWQVALASGIGYLIGESFGWGEWVGTLTTDRTTMVENEEGKNNGIRWIASKIVPPTSDWREYCRTALTIRGFYWWLPALVPLYFVGVDWFVIGIAILVLGVGFPIACELDKECPLNIKIGKWQAIGHWESQEVYYGIMQDMVMIGIVWSTV